MGACCPSHVISNIQIRHANKRLLWQTACSTVVARRTLGCLVCAAIRTANLSQAAAHADPQLAAAHSALPGPSDMPYTPQPRICAAIRAANPQPGRCTCRPPAGCCTCRLAWSLRHALYSTPRKGFACTNNTYRWLLSLLIANSKQCQATVAVLDTAAMLSRPYHECTCSRLPDARRDHGVRRMSTHKQGDMSSPLLECRPPFP